MTTHTLPNTFVRLLALASVLAIGAGCAQYSWSNEPTNEDATSTREAPVAVQTITAPASEGMRLERLTREFVETLHAQGMHGARWSEVAGEDYVACVVTETDVSGFGKQWSASAEVECSVRCTESIFQLERRGSAMRSGSNRPDDIADEHRAQAESAARRALRKAAVAIVSRCGY